MKNTKTCESVLAFRAPAVRPHNILCLFLAMGTSFLEKVGMVLNYKAEYIRLFAALRREKK